MRVSVLVKKFIIYFLKSHNEQNLTVEGILLSGSNSEVNKLNINSDLDVYIIINKEKKYRGVTIIDNFKIDFFASSIKQLKIDLELSLKTPKKVLVDMLANCVIINDLNDNLRKVKRRAMENIKNIPTLTSNEKIMIRYFLKDYLDTLQKKY